MACTPIPGSAPISASAGASSACNTAMRMYGSREGWSKWLGVSLPETGTYTGPTLLAPLHLSNGEGRYTEPNLWVVHE